jgi:Rrf2 family protein
MQLSTKGRYAVRAMVDLALQEQGKPVPRVDIAERQRLSADYIAQLFLDLQKAGLVRGVKGPGGGYVLEKPPAEIRVGDIIRAVEGPIALVDCVKPGGETSCPMAAQCVTRNLWQRTSNAISETLNDITLEDLRSQACEL